MLIVNHKSVLHVVVCLLLRKEGIRVVFYYIHTGCTRTVHCTLRATGSVLRTTSSTCYDLHESQFHISQSSISNQYSMNHNQYYM